MKAALSQVNEPAAPVEASPNQVNEPVAPVPESFSGRVWELRPVDHEAALSISQRLDLPDIVGRILAARGFGLDEAPSFLEPRLRDYLPDPSHLLGMEEAVKRLADALEDNEPIGILADYDVDGATSCALLTRHLRALGAVVAIDIPDRLDEGYGPNPKAFARLEQQGCQLVVVLDAGTTAFEPLSAAAAGGHEVIVVDHHVAEEHLPEALAVINPNRVDQESPLGDLAAVGVTFMLCVALNRILRQRGRLAAGEPDLRQWLDLVALGTVCDLVPLKGINRALVAQGLKVAGKSTNPGLVALADVAKLGTVSEASHFGFALGPRINAGGRTGQSHLGANLLTSDDPAEVTTIAAQLDALNQERRRIEKKVLEEALRQVEPAIADDPVLVVVAKGWSPGVVGVVASRLVERYHRPAIVIGIDEGGIDDEGIGKGSGRSIKGFDLGAAVIAARQEGLLEQGGGHPMAAGLTITEGKVEAFSAFLKARMLETWGPGVPPPAVLHLDAELQPSSLTLELGAALERLAPFGRGNPEPRLWLPSAVLHQVRRIGENHLDCRIGDQHGARLRGVAFRIADQPLGQALLNANGKPVHLAGRIKIDSWQGKQRAGFQIEDAAPV